LDWYHDFKDSSSLLANVGVANQFFPTFKAGLSYYQSIGKSNETRLELGGRFLRFATPRNLWMGIAGVERTFGSVWVNVRGSIISDQTNWYNSIFGQTRFYMRNDRNYIVAQGSVGTIPEVDNVDFQLNTFLSYLNTMVGVGYFHHFNHRTSAGFLANWYTFRISEERIENLYHMFFTVRHRF
jgi:YaiO family outer membrane protein